MIMDYRILLFWLIGFIWIYSGANLVIGITIDRNWKLIPFWPTICLFIPSTIIVAILTIYAFTVCP